VAEATRRVREACVSLGSHVTCVKHLCNWTEIASRLGSRNNRSAELRRSAFVQHCLLRVEYAPAAQG
jgi:hypothetical protein